MLVLKGPYIASLKFIYTHLFVISLDSGYVDFTEWTTFLAKVQTERMNYYKSSFLLKVRPI